MSAVEKLGVAMKNTQETRVALLEQSIRHINETLIRLEKNIDKRFNEIDQRLDKMDQRLDKFNDRLWSNFLWILATLFTLSTLICGIMAKGFHWLP